ncbi:MAG: acyltransferase [Chitinophagales bacterium]|nr:acyltransferase [Chitinophagales bacterium]
MAQTIEAQATQRKYFDSLDGYRTFGTLVVVMHHVPFIFFRTPFGYGWWVLQSFFVISGFLLTFILLKDKKRGLSLGKEFRDYYLKRFYRIFPLYWAFLALLSLIVISFGTTSIPLIKEFLTEYKDNWFLFWTYLYNYKDLIHFFQGIKPDLNPFLSHIWSLSVEEQFYLLLPLMVFLLSRKNLKRLVIGIIVISPLLRLGTYWVLHHLAYDPAHSAYFENNDFYKQSWISVVMLRATWCQMDCFAFGMALALWDFSWIKSAKKWFWWSLLGFIAIVTLDGIVIASKIETAQMLEMAEMNPILKKTLAIFPMWFAKFHTTVSEHLILVENYHFVYIYTIVNFLSFLIVLSCLRNKPFMNLMNNKGMIYTGKITYGVYLFHYPFLMLIIMFTIPVMLKVGKWSNKIFTYFLGDYIGLVGSQITSEIVLTAIYLPLLWIFSNWCFKYFETFFINLKYKVK